MSGFNPEMPDIDPSVDAGMNDFIDSLTQHAVESKMFSDAVVIVPAENRLLPGETPQQAHQRLQQRGSDD